MPELRVLVAQCQADLAGEADAWGELVSVTAQFLYPRIRSRVARREDAQDILQETFLRVSKSIKQLRDADRFFAWCSVIAVNALQEFRRKNKRKPLLLGDDIGSFEVMMGSWFADESQPDEIASKRLLYDVLFEIADSSSHLDHTLLLERLEGIEFQEMANRHGITKRAAEMRVYRLLKKVRLFYEKEEKGLERT